MRILVTGAGGFLGRRLVPHLAGRGHQVGALVRPGGRRPAPPGAARVLEADLSHHGAVEAALASFRPEAAVHLAWYTEPGRYWTSPANLDGVVEGIGLARALAAAGCRRLAAAGSCAEYDWSHARLVEGETPLRPATLYGAAKRALGMVLEPYCAASGLSLAWLRYNFLFGPGEPPGRLIPSVMEGLAAGRDVPCTAGGQRRDFMHVDEAAAATAAVLESGVEGAVNIATGEPHSVREVVETLAGIIGGPGRPRFGALPDRPGDPPELIPDVTRLTQEVGWRPALGLEAGLRRTLQERSAP